MAKTTTERLSVIEEKLEQNAREHLEINKKLDKIDCKFDDAIIQKADQSDVDKLYNRVWWIVGLFATAFISIVVYYIQHYKL